MIYSTASYNCEIAGYSCYLLPQFYHRLFFTVSFFKYYIYTNLLDIMCTTVEMFGISKILLLCFYFNLSIWHFFQ